VAAEQRVPHEQDDAEHEHLCRQQSEHPRSDGVARSFSDIACYLREFDSCKIYLLSSEVSAILGYLAEQRSDSS
jgi:hypothetical protein